MKETLISQGRDVYKNMHRRKKGREERGMRGSFITTSIFDPKRYLGIIVEDIKGLSRRGISISILTCSLTVEIEVFICYDR